MTDFNKIQNISKKVSPDTLLLFWQFTIKTLDELDIVINQELSIEMFLIRLLYLKNLDKKSEFNDTIINKSQNKKSIFVTNQNHKLNETKDNLQTDELNYKNKPISQIKNFSQKQYIEDDKEIKKVNEFVEINSFDELIEVCNKKKEIQLKHELENNVNLVSFENPKIEISFNENIDKNFVKNLSSMLFEWTNKRWVITFTKKIGSPTKKQVEKQFKTKLLEEVKENEIYNKTKEMFPDAELIDVNLDKNFKN